MRKLLFSLLLCSLVLTGCRAATHSYAPSHQPEYQRRPVVMTSPFKSDAKVVSNEAIKRALDGRIQLPKRCGIAVVQIQNAYFVQRAGRKTEYLHALTSALKESPRVLGATQIPDLLLPHGASVPRLREAAARLQCELVLVCRINSRTRYAHRVLRKDSAKVYSSAEVLLLHTRTGVVPLTAVVDEEHKVVETRSDKQGLGLWARAEREATVRALTTLGQRVSAFLAKDAADSK